MKIDHNPAEVSGARAARLESLRAGPGKSTGRPQGKSGDRVNLSSDAALANAAVKAVYEAPEMRLDMIERMKQLIAEGQLGHDAERLADAIIDRLLEQR